MSLLIYRRIESLPRSVDIDLRIGRRLVVAYSARSSERMLSARADL